MKVKIWAATAIGVSFLAYYLYQKYAIAKSAASSSKEKERHHLTNVFSYAKKLAVGH